MSTVIFLSSLNPIEKNDGTINASGTVEFYQQGTAFATPKAVYADSGLITSLGSIITLDSAGHLECYLNGDYDIKIKDSSGGLLRSVHNINPVTTVSGVDPSLIPNGSFENTNFTNWTLFEWNAGANVVDNIDQTHGAYSAKFVSAGGGGGYITSALFDCNPTTNIFTSFSLKSNVANVRNIVQLLWYDKNQAFLSATTLLDDSATNPTSWTNKTYISTPPANAVFGAIKLVGCDSSVATAGNTRYDNIYIAEDENNLVHLTGSINETITGNKTFSGNTVFSGTGTHSAQEDFNSTLNANANMAITSDISPAQITSDQNDYNPTGLASASILRINTDAFRSITGIVGGSDGRVLVLINIGTFNIGLKHDTTSTAANRFYLDVTGTLLLLPNSSIALIYDSTSSRWRPVDRSSNGLGTNQIPHDVSGSRAANNTAYQNTTNRPITVYYASGDPGGGNPNITCQVSTDTVPSGYVTVARFQSAANIAVSPTTTFIVPPGFWYRINQIVGANTIVVWTEMY